MMGDIMKKIFILFIIVFCFAGDFTLMFWNVENLFDIKDDEADALAVF